MNENMKKKREKGRKNNQQLTTKVSGPNVNHTGGGVCVLVNDD